MENIKIISMDFDGTLLTSDKKITDKTKSILKRCRDNNYIIIGITARNLASAKDVLDIMIETKHSAKSIVEEKGLKQVVDTGAIEKVVDEIIANNPKQVEQYKGGNERLFGFFVGQTMKASGGKVNPKVVNEILKKKLG